MAILDGEKVAQESLLDIAKLSVVAAKRAPQMTGKVEVESLVFTGEDLQPIMDFQDAQADAMQMTGMGGRSRWGTTRYWYDQGMPPVIVMFGSNSFVRSELNWNCGACGWSTCAEFNRYSAQIRKTVPGKQIGPSCAWKYMDFVAATDWAAAAVWQHNVESRLLTVEADILSLLGYQKDCAESIALGIGPAADLVWFSRGLGVKESEVDDAMLQGYEMASRWSMPQFWTTFFGTTIPPVRYDARKFQEEIKHAMAIDMPQLPQIDEAREELKKRTIEIMKRVETSERERDLERAKKPVLTDEDFEKEFEHEWPKFRFLFGGVL